MGRDGKKDEKGGKEDGKRKKGRWEEYERMIGTEGKEDGKRRK